LVFEFPKKPKFKLVSGRIGVVDCELNDDTGELVCELSLVEKPDKTFLVTASRDATNKDRVKITQIKSSDRQPIPGDLINEIKLLVTDLVKGEIEIE